MREIIEVLVPNFQTADLIFSGILLPLENHWERDLRLTIVDDGSGPQETRVLDDILPGFVHFEKHETRQGPAATFNHLFTIATAPILFLCNSDIIIPNIEQLDTLRSTLEHTSHRAILGTAEGPRFMDKEARPYTLAPTPERSSLCPQDYVSACAMMLPKRVLKSTTPFDTSYTNGYYEDSDACFQWRSNGWKTYYVRTLIGHIGNQAMIRLQLNARDDPAKLNFLHNIERNRQIFLPRWRDFLAPRTDDLQTAMDNHFDMNHKLIGSKNQ